MAMLSPHRLGPGRRVAVVFVVGLIVSLLVLTLLADSTAALR